MTAACFLVIGYNNTRVHDVALLRDLCHREFRAALVLVTDEARPHDTVAADAVLVAPFDVDVAPRAASRGAAAIGRRGLRPIGVLPFSDRGVVLGAHLASRFELPGAAPAEAVAGLDKHRLRAIEAAAADHPAGYTPVRSLAVHSLGEFEAAVAHLGGTAFVKPTSEGNSRGCQLVPGLGACPEIWAALAPYHERGVMVETLVTGAREYSWDYVGGARWLTEKHTTTGRFRAEFQQVVPAPLDPAETALLDRAGDHVRRLVSPANGAFHNELFLRAHGAAAVETNMRPGGMHIWDLARLAFPGFDPWLAWLRWSTGDEPLTAQPVARAASGIRMLRAPGDGVVVSTPDIAAVAAKLDIPLHHAELSTSPSARVRAEVTDNAGFVGKIILVAEDAKTLLDRLDRLGAGVEERIDVRAR